MTREINRRESPDMTVTLWYHGKDAAPKLTLTVDNANGTGYCLTVPEERAMDYFLHPNVYALEV
jgi:hypothetical protein